MKSWWNSSRFARIHPLAGFPLAAAALTLLMRSAPVTAQPYRNAELPIETRVSDLVSRMTLEEKFWQLFMLSTPLEGTIERCEHGAFGFQISSSGDSACSAAYVNRIQRRFVEGTRLGIPIIAFDEAVHGLVLPGATVFPQAIALAATFDVRLMEAVATKIADECRSRGIRQVLSPVVNIASDVRWGRVEETYGEDPYLSSEMGAAFANALERAGVVTTPKHFVANVGDGGRDSYPIALGERALREIHFPPFEACIRRGGSRSIMMAYNSVDGAPCTASEWLMRRVLKEELGFTGFVISDAAAVGGANVLHFTAADYAEATARAMNAGLDVIFQTSFDHRSLFMPAFEDGRIDAHAIDEAVSRVLRAKFELGLFDRPYTDTASADRRSWSTPGRGLAETAALESIVLLKNEGGTLPISKKVGRIAVIGADAREARLGGYSGPGSGRINIFEGIWLKAGGDERVAYARGCGRTPPTHSGGSSAPAAGTGASAAAAAEEGGIAEAVKLARESDVAVVVVGIEEGEFRDRARLSLPGRQEELILRVADTGTPVVVVIVGGSAVTMSRWLDRASAVLDVWYPGEAGGTAIAAVLFGDYNPAGRLPVTFPLEEGQLPLVYNHKPTGRGDGYLDLPGEPLFPFGFGLSYTTFEYADLSFDRDRIAPGDSAVVRCTVRNAGARGGDEVVQLYIRDEIASVARPVMELKGFRRLRLDAGETKEVRFTIAPETLRMLDAQLRPIVEPGAFRVMIGSSSKDIRLRGILTVSE